MDEMTLLQDLGQELAADDVNPPVGLRARVLAATGEAAAAAGPVTAVGDVTRRSVRRRRWSRPVVVLAAAASVTAALVVAPTLPIGQHHTPSASAAAAVLERIAAAGAARPAPTAPKGSFVYTQTVHDPTETESYLPGGRVVVETLALTQRRDWMPADGHGPARIEERDDSGPWQSGGTWPCDDKCPRSYRDDLPTDPDRMLAYIYAHKQGQNPPNFDAFDFVQNLLVDSLLPPKTWSALFTATARIPGTVVVQGEHDLLGRPVIAIGLSNGLVRKELLFDPTSYVLRGWQLVNVRADRHGAVGTRWGRETILRTGIVPAIGALPQS